MSAPDIFLSYNREDQARAKLFADAFQSQGFSVWWDVGLRTGEAYDQVTEKALNDARAVVVLWSTKSVGSRWVRAEATLADRNKTLVPVMIEACRRPIMFELTQTAELSHWKGDPRDAAWLAFLADLHAFLGREKAPPPSPTPRPSASGPARILPRPIVLGGIALAAIALVTAIVMMMLGPKPPAAQAAEQNVRVAFFGFTAADGDALSAQVAGVATEETFATLTALGIETAARGDTEGVALKDQMEKTATLGARYALGGSVRTSGDQVTVTIRLDDAQTRATLWLRQLTGGKAQSESLPVQAAAKTTNLLRCLIAIRPGMAREDASAMGLVTRACDTDPFDPELLTRWREVVGVAPRSSAAESQLGIAWILQSLAATPDDRRTMLQQARQAFARAQAIEPASTEARSGLAIADIASDRPLAEIIEDLNAMLGVSADRSNRRNISNVTFVRLALLSDVGRAAEAARLGRIDAAADPLNVALQAFYTGALYASRQAAEARRLGESLNRRMADSGNWQSLAFQVIFTGDDLAPVVAAAPPSVSPEAIACMQELAKATRAPDANARKAGARRAQACMQAGNFNGPAGAVSAIAGLGDMNAAFAALDQGLDRSNPVAFMGSSVIVFLPHTKALRTDPRFLPLMKKAGIYQYWLDSKTQPDVCDTTEEHDIPVCVQLRKDRPK